MSAVSSQMGQKIIKQQENVNIWELEVKTGITYTCFVTFL